MAEGTKIIVGGAAGALRTGDVIKTATRILKDETGALTLGKGRRRNNDDDTFDNEINLKTNISQPKIDDILAKSRGERPDPSTYLSQVNIDVHLDLFDDGAVRFASAADVAKFGTARPPDGGFVIPKREFDKIIAETGGDLRIVEQRLGLDSGSLSNGNTIALQINSEDFRGLRIPSGNERGANSQWLPGGFTS